MGEQRRQRDLTPSSLKACLMRQAFKLKKLPIIDSKYSKIHTEIDKSTFLRAVKGEIRPVPSIKSNSRL